MQVSPDAERFSELHSIEETEEMREKMSEIYNIKDSITAIGPKENLLKLQEDLRKAGYRKLT